MNWDQQAILQLRAFWAEGLSANEIGRRMGVSKNSIVGKAHRLELDGRPSPIRAKDSGAPKAPPSIPRPKITLPPLESSAPKPIGPLAQQPPPPVPARVAAVARPVLPQPPPPMPAVDRPSRRRTSAQCCWPIGEPGTKTFRFCDGVSVPGKPYCDEHARIAYVKIRDREDYA